MLENCWPVIGGEQVTHVLLEKILIRNNIMSESATDVNDWAPTHILFNISGYIEVGDVLWGLGRNDLDPKENAGKEVDTGSSYDD